MIASTWSSFLELHVFEVAVSHLYLHGASVVLNLVSHYLYLSTSFLTSGLLSSIAVRRGYISSYIDNIDTGMHSVTGWYFLIAPEKDDQNAGGAK